MTARGPLLAGLLACSAPLAAVAQQDDDAAGPGSRCAVLGQVAVSVWADTISALGAGDRTPIEEAVARLDNVTAIYERLECDIPVLAATLDCVIDAPASSRASTRLRTCARENGLTPGE